MDKLENFQRNTDARNFHIQCKYNLHTPNANLTKYQGGVYHTDINLYSNTPPKIKSLNQNTQVFKPALGDYILTQST
jgi:hypothetical protein